MHVTYIIAEHDGGWAYRLDDVYSDTYSTRDAAYRAAQEAAEKQKVDSVEIRDEADEPRLDTPDDSTKVDLTREASHIVDANFDVPQPDLVDQRQQEIAEETASDNEKRKRM